MKFCATIFLPYIVQLRNGMATNTLQLVNLIGSDGKPTSGLVPTHNTLMTDLSIDEQAAVFYARTFNRIDYVFFRRFSDGRSSQILAYVVDNSNGGLNDKALAELHWKVWLYGLTPLLYVAWPTKIDVLACARKPDFWKNNDYQYNPAKTLDVADLLNTASEITNELDQFSALRLVDGTFWEEPRNADLIDSSESAHRKLIQSVVDTDIELDGENKPIMRRLLLLMVLIKYLEDRRVFPKDFFSKFHGASSFFEVLKGNSPQEVYDLLDSLENKFNGDVFSLPDKGQSNLTPEILEHFANLVGSKIVNKQFCFWRQYSFEHIPVEIISNLYQRFVHGVPGAVYTPPYLASLMLDYAMPYEGLTGEERVLDPACGSGIFLVGAFRRLINLWRSQNDWQRPEVDTLKRMLRHSIYGIELDSSAIDLTSFSLCLAICDALQPEVIWNKLKFDKLRESNLVKADFFSVLRNFYRDKTGVIKDGFDVVIGNPPFESKISEDGKKVDQAALRQDSKRGALPDNQSAYLFLEQAFCTLRPDGRVCLIQPSGLLYNRKAQEFRTALFRKYKVDTIFDFVSIRKLYDGADTKTIAVLAQASEPPEDHRIVHLTFRRTVSVKERICFELDHYDWHFVSQNQAEHFPSVWRSNLLGGGRLFDISKRLQSMRKLSEYIRKQKGWDYGEGFIVGKEVEKDGKVLRTPAPFLTDKPFLPLNSFTETGLDETKITIVTDTLFHTAYTEKRYNSPRVLFRKIDSLPIAFWDKGFLAYNHNIVGINAPHDQISELRKLYNTMSLNYDIYRFLIVLNSASIVGKSTAILKNDIDELPYPEDLNEFSFSFWEKALCEDVVENMTDFIRHGQDSELLKKAANMDDLRTYSDMFIRMLKSVYSNLQASNPIFLNGLTCQPFYFGEPQDFSWLAEHKEVGLRKLIYDEEKHKHLRTIRVLRFYDNNFLLLIKPDRLRYWIRSTAIRDADETIVDLSGQGY